MNNLIFLMKCTLNSNFNHITINVLEKNPGAKLFNQHRVKKLNGMKNQLTYTGYNNCGLVSINIAQCISQYYPNTNVDFYQWI